MLGICAGLSDASCQELYFWRLGCISPEYSKCLLDRIELRGYDAPVAEIGRREPTVSSEAEEKNRALVHRFLMAHARGDLDALGEMLAHDFVDHSLLPGQVPGRGGYIQSAAEQHAALSDIRYIIEYQATDGDMVISRLTMRATHDRETRTRSPRSGARTSLPRFWRKSSNRHASASASSKILGWRGAFSKPRSLRRCPKYKVGRSTPTTSLLERSEETSTISWS
jgi:ketosteroid isomerase-like protein